MYVHMYICSFKRALAHTLKPGDYVICPSYLIARLHQMFGVAIVAKRITFDKNSQLKKS